MRKHQQTSGLAFDLSKRNTGVAVFRHDHLQRTHQRSYQHCPYFGDVLLAFERDLLHLLSLEKNLDWIGYEEVRPVNKYHAEQHFGMVGILAMRASQHEIPLLGVNTMSMRKRVLGSGKLTKAEVMNRVHELLTPKGQAMVENHDLADAVTVGWFITRHLLSDPKA